MGGQEGDQDAADDRYQPEVGQHQCSESEIRRRIAAEGVENQGAAE